MMMMTRRTKTRRNDEPGALGLGREGCRRTRRTITDVAVGLLALAGRVESQVATTQPPTPAPSTASDPCLLASGITEVTIGKPTAVCLVVNPLVWELDGENRFYSQVLIVPDADDFSRFSVTGSWQTIVEADDPILATFGTDVGVHVESMGRYSFQKAYRRLGEQKTFPIHTAIIAVDKGEVTGISWDDGCHFCGSSSCEENTYAYSGELTEDPGKDCYWPDSTCSEGSGDAVSDLCQLTVYVVWTGTDSDGNYFTSFSKRLSMYAGASLDSYIDDAADTFEVIE